LIKNLGYSVRAKIDIGRETMTERCSAPANPGCGTLLNQQRQVFRATSGHQRQ
jgi:hypothetical protein